MDKRATKILLASILSIVIVSLLFLVALRFTQPSCELIFIEPDQLRGSQLASFGDNSTKPVRSHDKTLLVKMAAYLEYHPRGGSARSTRPLADFDQAPLGGAGQPASGPLSSSSSGAVNGPQQQQQQQQQQQPQPGGPMQSGSGAPTSYSGSQRHPSPSVPVNGVLGASQAHPTHQQQQQPLGSGSSPSPAPAGAKTNEKRYLPLELEEIETDKREDNRTHYKLDFNCTTLRLVLVRQPERVYVESMELELRPPSRHKGHCRLQLVGGVNSNGAFMVESGPLQTGGGAAQQQHQQQQQQQQQQQHQLAALPRFYCDTHLSFRCYHEQTNLLATLHIVGFEYEATPANTSLHVKSTFSGQRKGCDQ